MRSAQVYYKDTFAGTISETEDGYIFQYDQGDYVKSGVPISLTMPIQEASYESRILFPFFDNLIPEGWLLEIGVNNWKLDRRDRFGLLLTLCKDCIGCVSIISNESE
ncbi:MULTISPECIES: HipA N-terminal domain-containing protein [Chitinophagaceae]